MDQLARRLGQMAAVTQQLPPEPGGAGLERHRTKSVAHLTQQHGQMIFKPLPIAVNELAPALHLRPRVLALKPGGDGRGVDRPIGLGKGRQTTHAHATDPAEEASHPNQQDQRRGGGDEPLIISQRFQNVRPLAIGAVFRRPDLLVILLLGILFGGQ